MRWCDSRGWGANEEEGITPCFTQSIFALGPILFLAIAGPYHYRELCSTPERAILLDARKRLVDPLYWPKLLLSLIMTFGPVATVAIVLTVPSPDQYSIAFFLSHTLRAVSWGLSIPLVFEENRSIEFTYNSWVVLSWWVLNLISNSVVLVTSRGFSSTDPSVLASSLLNTLQFFSNAALVLFGFLVPKHIEDVANNESAPLLHQAGSSGAMLGSSDAMNIQDWNGSGSALRSSWCERLWSWRRRRAGGAYAQLDDSLIQNDYTSSARGGSMLGTPSVIARQEAGRRAGGGGGGSRSNFFQNFLRARQPFGERTSEDGSMHASRSTSLQHHYHHHERQDSRRLSKEWSGTMASARNFRYGGHGPVYTISIPRWVLMDNNGEVVEIDSLIEGEMYGDEEEESGAAEGLERRPSDPHEPKDRCSSVPDIADTKVAFEIELKSDEEGEDEASSRYPSVYSVIHSYEDFEALHHKLVERFGPEATTGLKPPVLRARDAEVVKIIDVRADMRALAVFLRNILACGLQCPELTTFLFPEGFEEEQGSAAGEEEGGGAGGAAAEAGEGAGAGEGPRSPVAAQAMEGAEEEEEDLIGVTTTGAEGEGEEDVAELRKIAHAMRKDVPVGERHIRLRTFYNVIGGNDIYRWLRDNNEIRECSSRQESIELATALVNHGLLLPMVTGYSNDELEEDEGANYCDSRVWLFRYNDRLGRRPVTADDPDLVALFAQPVRVQIPKWSETAGRYGDLAQASSDLHVTYEIVVTTQMEGWAVSRRYADFSKLNKRLKRLGIIPPAPLPPKRAVSSSSKLGSPDFLDDRRRGLEHYLNSVVIAAQESPSVLARTVMNFLDPDALSLCIAPLASPHGDEDLDDEDDEEEEEDRSGPPTYVRRRSPSLDNGQRGRVVRA